MRLKDIYWTLPFGNEGRGTRVYLWPFVYVAAILLIAVLSDKARAEDIHFEAGAANASYTWTGAHYARISARFGDDKWALGMAHVETQDWNDCPPWDCRIYAWRNLFVDVTRYVKWDMGEPGGFKAEFGMGPSISQHMTRITPAHINFHLSMGLRYKRATLTIHHYSNAGTSPTGYNMGQDAVTLGWVF
jgi:hypothetical protein